MKQKREHPAIWKYIVMDLGMAAVILGIFFMFFAVIPALQVQKPPTEVQIPVPEGNDEPADTELPDPLPEKTQAEDPETDIREREAAAEKSSEPEKSSVPENRDDPEEPEDDTAAGEKFAEFFTEEVQRSELSYSSPNVSVQIRIVKDTEHSEKAFTCYIADIHITDAEYLKTGVPEVHSIALAEEITDENGAILGVNGDYYIAISKGLIVRNGTVLQNEEGTSDLCVLYRDGRMETYGPEEYRLEDLLKEDPYQVWSFGPALLGAGGEAKTEFNTGRNLTDLHPRTALGYYEPGHYCFVVIDGRGMGNSAGASMETLSRVMADLGCAAAYNLDGGASSSMVFDGEVISRPSGGTRRRVSDMVMICDVPASELPG